MKLQCGPAGSNRQAPSLERKSKHQVHWSHDLSPKDRGFLGGGLARDLNEGAGQFKGSPGSPPVQRQIDTVGRMGTDWLGSPTTSPHLPNHELHIVSRCPEDDDRKLTKAFHCSDQVLSPPSDILTEPMEDEDFGIGHGTCEAESLQYFFHYLGLSAGVRYRVKRSSNFLCLDWVRHRIWNDLEDGRPFPEGDTVVDTSEYTIEQLHHILREWGMVPCDADADDRVSGGDRVHRRQSRLIMNPNRSS